MEGSWPIILEGVDCGRVTASREGAYTVFTAEATYAGDLVRISLYGSGREGYLGILAPDGSGDGILRLRRHSTCSSSPAFQGNRNTRAWREAYRLRIGANLRGMRAPPRTWILQAGSRKRLPLRPRNRSGTRRRTGRSRALTDSGCWWRCPAKKRARPRLGERCRTAHKRQGIRCISALKVVLY